MRVGIEWAELEDPVDVEGEGAVSVSDLGGCVGSVRSRALEERWRPAVHRVHARCWWDMPWSYPMNSVQQCWAHPESSRPETDLGNDRMDEITQDNSREFQGQVHPTKPPLTHSGTCDCLLSPIVISLGFFSSLLPAF